MPFLWWGLAGLSSFILGVVYEKESDKPVIDSTSGANLSWWDKTLLVVLGLGAYWLYKKAKR